MAKFKRYIKSIPELQEVLKEIKPHLEKGFARDMTFVFTIQRQTRSLEQNDLFHAIVEKVFNFYRESAPEGMLPDLEGTKQFLKEKFGLFNMVNYPDGRRLMMPRSTTEYDIEEMSEFIEKIVNYYTPYGLDFGISTGI